MNENKENQTECKRAQPLFVCQRKDTTIAVLPDWIRSGMAVIRLHRHEGEKIKKLQCKVSTQQFCAMDTSAQAGELLLEAVDVMPPDVCTRLGYRKDNKGYTRTMTVVALPESGVQIAIVCSLCAYDKEGHICSAGQYRHTEKIQLRAQDIRDLVKVIQLAAEGSAYSRPSQKKRTQYARKVDVSYDA